MSAKRDLYICLRDAICEILQGNGRPLVKHVSRWNSQPTNFEQERSYRTPAVFIGFSSIEWDKNKQKSVQSGTLIVTTYIEVRDLDTEDKVVKDWEVADAVHKVLQNFEGDFFTSPNRIAEREDANHGGVIVWETDYEVTLEDTGADSDQDKDDVLLTLKVETEVDIDNDNIRTGDGVFE